MIGDIPDGYTVNIEKVLDNNKVYTAVINGYPYKTPSELGVYNKYDAFMATKQAVYSVLYNYNVDSHYRGVDERGDNIKKAIKTIVNKARNETKSPSTALLSFTKNGNFVEDPIDNKYYSQTYTVKSDIDMREYTITATAKLPSGSFIADSSNTRKNTFAANEKFKILVPKQKANELEKVEGVISVQAKCKNYPVFYAKKDTKYQPYALAFDPYGDNSAQLKVEFNMGTGKIKINKTDSETSNPISGVTFQLKNQNGKVIANATTNNEGIANFSNLLPGKYTLKEISTNDNYIITKQEFEVNVEYNKTTTKNIENDHKKGNIKVYKVDKDNHKIALGNVEFDLYSEEFKRVIGTYTTNADGEFSVKDLRIGQYELIEKNTGKWYNLAENPNVKVEWNAENPIVVENELKKGQVKVVKVDKDNNQIKLEGVEFEVLDEKNNVLEKIITNEKRRGINK